MCVKVHINKGEYMKYLVGLILSVVVIGLMGKWLTENEFRESNSVYCPSKYKVIKGDGIFIPDSTSPLALQLINVISVEDGYIYTDRDEAINMHNCIIKGD